MERMEQDKANNTAQKILWWIIAALSMLVSVAVSFIITTIVSQGKIIVDLQVKLAQSEFAMRQTDKLTEVVRQEQQTRTGKFNEIDTKIQELMYKVRVLQDKITELNPPRKSSERSSFKEIE